MTELDVSPCSTCHPKRRSGIFGLSGFPGNCVGFSLVVTGGESEIGLCPNSIEGGLLDYYSAVNKALKIHKANPGILREFVHASEPNNSKISPAGKDFNRALFIIRGGHYLKVVLGNQFGRGPVNGSC